MLVRCCYIKYYDRINAVSTPPVFYKNCYIQTYTVYLIRTLSVCSVGKRNLELEWAV